MEKEDMIELEQEALLLNQDMLKELKNIINDINDKPQHLLQLKHPHWGSILGSEEEIRLAVLKDELEIWEQRTENDPDSIPYLGYIRNTLQNRMEELKPLNRVKPVIKPVNTIQEHEMTWGKEYE
jgi:hypothetical protein